jgi:hypothetical protein
MFGGDGRRYMWLDAQTRQVRVSGVASRRIMELLYSADHSLQTQLFADSGARCFSFEQLVAHARKLFGAKGIDVSARLVRLPAGTALDDEDGRWTRYEDGCAVLAGGAPGPDRDSVVVEVFQRRSLPWSPRAIQSPPDR